MLNRICLRCEKELESDSHRNQILCLECKKIQKRAKKKRYRELNKAQISAYQKEYRELNKEHRELNKEQAKIYAKEYLALNRVRINAYQKEYRELNKEKIRISKKRYYESNKAYVVSRTTNYGILQYKVNLQYRLRVILRKRLLNALKSQNASKTCSAVRDLGCTIPELKVYLESKFQPGMTWENQGQWHIDHIKPLASFDLTDPEQQKLACHYTNLQPLWAEDNIKKSDLF